MNTIPDFSQINTFIFDVDGVLTDGTLQSYASGEQSRKFNIKDGYAIERALKMGYNILIISGAFEEGVEMRLNFLKISDIFLHSHSVNRSQGDFGAGPILSYL